MTAAVSPQPSTRTLRARAAARHSEYLADLAALVAIDSGSYSPDGVNRVAAWLADRLERCGATTRTVPVGRHRDRALGNALVARKQGSRQASAGGRRILLAGHMDTVFDDGTAAARPFSLTGSLAHGPGVSDDKGGLLAGLSALEILTEAGFDDYDEIVFLATPDEEIGSPGSAALTRVLAAEADFALALECARENGDVVIARKGVAEYLITIEGRAAHAGIEPERGAHAALAAAHLTIALQALNGREDDATVNVGVLQAGSRPNIVPAQADLRVEVRATSAVCLERVEEAIMAAAADLPVRGTTATVRQLDLCPAMEATDASLHMLSLARSAGRELGVAFGAASTGGVGDANTIAATGTPVLDGLGPVGGADHTPEEWLDTTTLTDRITLLALLITRLCHTTTP
ncbi:M20 family metallopeptidase [Streptomyces yangpuensis]|uniref:M20 family metallopeptidase n=1 Tax=Streptomyces yangpuensis TaxID=1648182 RepID=UPI0006290F06|nr:M20 family metallopeptidase [Streptomyces yangpuensis]